MEPVRVIVSDMVTIHRSLTVALSSTPIDYQAHAGPAVEQFCDRIRSAMRANGACNKCLLRGQLRHCVLTLRLLLITRFELLCNSIQLENHVRYAFNELCSLLDVSRDQINKLIDDAYGETSGTVIQCNELLDILVIQRRRAIVNKVIHDVSIFEKIAQQESYLIRTFCAALLTLLPPPSWGDSVSSYILREGLDSVDEFDWTDFLMPGVNSQLFRNFVTMVTNKIWKVVSQDLVAMDHVSYSGISATSIYDIATNKVLLIVDYLLSICTADDVMKLEMYTLPYTLLYAGVQVERHAANRDQDYVTCKISTLLLTEKCHQYGSHGNTFTAHTIVNDLLQPCCSIFAMWQQSFSHTHFTSCLQANAVQVKLYLLRGVANVLQDCIQWYHSQLHRYINSWHMQSFILLLMGDLPLLLNFMQQQLLPLVNSQLVGVANQLQILVDDSEREYARLIKQCALIREHLSHFLKCFYENLMKRYQQLWKQPIKLVTECAPTEVTKESVDHTLLPCVKACATLPLTTQEICVTFCVTVTIQCWRNCLLSNGQRYSKQLLCQLLSDYTYMVSSSHDPAISSTTRNCINHLPVVMETRKALYKLCGIYYHDEYDGSHDTASHDPVVTEIINTILLETISTDQWAASMATRKKVK